MRFLLLFFFLFSNLISYAQIEKIEIDGQFYTFESKIYDETELDSGQKEVVKIFRHDSLGNKKPILSHVLKEKWGDCNSESLELGDYLLTDSLLTFYSFWCRRGDAPASPYGARIQKYKFQNSKLRLIESQIYIETTAIHLMENKGIQFLFEKPKTVLEKKEFATYIATTEKTYHAKFVFGKQSDKLIKTVKNHLQSLIENETKDWLKEQNSFGVKL